VPPGIEPHAPLTQPWCVIVHCCWPPVAAQKFDGLRHVLQPLVVGAPHASCGFVGPERLHVRLRVSFGWRTQASF